MVTPQFKVGDRVRITWDRNGWTGRTGTIDGLYDNETTSVHLDEEFKGYTDPIWSYENLELIATLAVAETPVDAW